jgi:hypothetical protein
VALVYDLDATLDLAMDLDLGFTSEVGCMTYDTS